METIIVLLNPGKMENPDLDLLRTESANDNWPAVVRLLREEVFKGNDLSQSAQIYISERDTAEMEECRLVFAGEG